VFSILPPTLRGPVTLVEMLGLFVILLPATCAARAAVSYFVYLTFGPLTPLARNFSLPGSPDRGGPGTVYEYGLWPPISSYLRQDIKSCSYFCAPPEQSCSRPMWSFRQIPGLTARASRFSSPFSPNGRKSWSPLGKHFRCV